MSAQLSLRLLGGLVLERPDGIPVTGRAAQRRRLGLLALLALAPGRCLSRDRLVGYLWPEAGTEQARHLLAVAVYELRKILGDEVMVARGDDLELKPALMRTDVADFEAAVAERRWEEAAALYAGPLLDGFFLGDAPEFERWVDGERDRLARLFSSSLESLARARAQADDKRGALEVWRRLAVLDPYNSRTARELMNALDATGDRAGAIRHARVHATLLREELGAEPDPDVEQLANRLRTAPYPVRAAPLQPHPDPHPAVPASPNANVDVAEAFASAPLPAHANVLPVMPPAHHGGGTRGRPHKGTIMAAVMVLVTGAALAAVLWVNRGRVHAVDCAGAPSIAVLPFRTLSSTEEHSYFGDGLAEEILNALSRIECLQVVPRTAAFAFREGDVQDAARRLDVSHSLSGQWMGDSAWLRVHARLVETRTGREIWSHPYERTGPWTLRDIADVQQEIATAVAGELSSRFIGGPGAPFVDHRTENQQAFLALYHGRRSLERRTVPDLLKARQLFAEAVQLDPDFADAHAALAEVTALLGAYDYGLLHPREAYPDALRSARLALARDSMLAEAHATLGSVYFNHYYQWERADSAFQRAIAVKRGYTQSYHWYALLLVALGRVDDARHQLEEGLRHDRNSVILRAALSRNHYFARDFAAAIHGYLSVLESDSTFLPAHLGLGLAYAQSGRNDEAVASFRQAERIVGQTIPVLHGLLGYALGLTGDSIAAREHLRQLELAAAVSYVPSEYFALVHISLGDTEAAITDLERAYENGSGGVAYLAVEPVLDPLRSSPRFNTLMDRVRLR